MHTFDVVVIGLGPAGAVAAATAARRGARVLALDRKPRPGVPVQCAELVPGLIAREAGGIVGALVQHIARMATYVEDEPPDLRCDLKGLMIDRAAFDAGLLEAARRAGAQVRLGAAVEAIGASGVVRTRDGLEAAALAVVGADGPRSIVARALGLAPAEVAETRQIAVPLPAGHHATDIFLSADIEGGYGWLFPKGRTANLGIGVAATARAQLKPLLGALHRRLAAEGRVGTGVLGHTGGPIPVGGLVGPLGWLAATPVLLAGDAAGLANPVTGAGINPAVISGALAGEAAAVFAGGGRRAAGDYAEEIEALFRPGLERALRHRRRLLALQRGGRRPSPGELRSGWIAYDGYWRG